MHAGNANALAGILPISMSAEELDLIEESRLDIVFWIESKSFCFIKEEFPIYLCSQDSENTRITISGEDLYINEEESRTVCSMESNPGEMTSTSTPWAAQNNLIIGQKLSAVKSEIKRIGALDLPIPSSKSLENTVLQQKNTIINNILEFEK